MLRRKGLRFNRFFKDGTAASIGSKNPVTCSSSSTVGSVLNLMISGKRKIPVVDKGSFMGIVTANDVLDYAGAGNKHKSFDRKRPLSSPIESIMDDRVVKIPASSRLEKAWSTFKEYRRGSYPLTNGSRVVGILADWDFLKHIRGNVGVSVQDIMISRPAHVKEHYTLEDVAKIMVKGGYRRLPVTKSGILTGVVTPSDLLEKLQETEGFSLKSGPPRVFSVMKTEVKVASPEEDVGTAVRRMLASKVGGLPVVEDQELVGIITESDVVQGLA